ncbi:MAG TPA: sulfate ABC transporter permease subunit CysT [Stellaceae bacterium]|nr:sulfate ABC transporter permease subunit CysT [Stellaceae bacterium]
MRRAPFRVLPGFGPSLGVTLFVVSTVVVIPLGGLFVKASGLSATEAIAQLTSFRVAAAFRLSFGLAFVAALVNGIIGLATAWVLERYEFPGRRILDALVDLPFALPTAVAGITLAALYANDGWIGALLHPFGIAVSYTRSGIFLALVFVGLPYVIRTLQPVLADVAHEAEEAALTLGARAGQVFFRIILPPLIPALLSGVALAFARGVGEYGSVIFIAGNMPGKTEILPLVIVTELEQFNDAGAALQAGAMLITAFAVLLLINLLGLWSRRRHGA